MIQKLRVVDSELVKLRLRFGCRRYASLCRLVRGAKLVLSHLAIMPKMPSFLFPRGHQPIGFGNVSVNRLTRRLRRDPCGVGTASEFLPRHRGRHRRQIPANLIGGYRERLTEGFKLILATVGQVAIGCNLAQELAIPLVSGTCFGAPIGGDRLRVILPCF